MADEKKSSKFGLGLLIGTVLGGLASFFLSPKSGEENREEVVKKVEQLKKLLEEKEIDKKVKEIFGEVSDEATKIYAQAKEWLIEDLAQLKDAVEHIDKEKYTTAVEKVVKRVHKGVKKDSKQLDKLKKQLMREWEKLN